MPVKFSADKKMPFFSRATYKSFFSLSISSVYSWREREGELNTTLAKVRKFHLDEGFLRQFLVDLWPVGDVLGSMGIVQRRHGLLAVALSRGDGSNDGGLGATT